MGEKSVADLLAATLVSRGVSRVYGVAGGSLSGRGDNIVDLARTNLWR
jgi:thiamine pyrophosphate-dependent acetolactate synthase large subunit-like protein